MRIPSMSRSLVVEAALGAAALPVLLPSPTYAADAAGPATCYLADENDTIIEPRQEYVPHEGAGTLPVQPSPIVPGEYTLEVSAPALNFDPDRPDMHFVCQVFYSPLGNVRLVDADGTVLATQRYGNDQNDPSRAHSPRGTKSSRARRSEATTLPLARLIRMIPRTHVLLGPTRTS